MTSTIPEPDQTPAGPAFEGRLLDRPDDEVVDQGAGFDIGTLMSRRRLLAAFGIGAGSMALAACGGGASSSGAGAGASATTSGGGSAAEEIPEETNGPYPADGTNGLNVLQQSGIERSDIRSSLDGGTTAEGVPLEFTFSLTDIAEGRPFEGAALYVWHCDAEGRYSMYSSGVEEETYLRGIQVADADGKLTFSTIVPGCYDGRWTHLHFEIYPDLASATSAGNAIATSQVAFPETMLTKVYADDAYVGSADNLARTSLEQDMVFSDGYALQMGAFTGSVDDGFRGSLSVAVDTRTTPSAGGMGGGMGGPGRG
ncbi:intradiol ring-cleavage dioxygenase [Nocardioides sp.]|uniref:intradiol ring-cleavage dioxygenase n=1 Tax=Nocardioides sp. TaxID=35761 RepID=UPI003511AF3D